MRSVVESAFVPVSILDWPQRSQFPELRHRAANDGRGRLPKILSSCLAKNGGAVRNSEKCLENWHFIFSNRISQYQDKVLPQSSGDNAREEGYYAMV